jgi:hypothetical protein
MYSHKDKEKEIDKEKDTDIYYLYKQILKIKNMASRKTYYNEKEQDSQGELQIYRNADGDLFVSITNHNSQEEMWLTLPPSDTVEIITELANDLGYNLIPNTHQSSS